MDTYYITTPIYYVNDKPHIGHLYSDLIADVISRLYRLSGNEVMFLTGTDEHGQKVEIASKKAELDTQLFVDKLSKSFFALSEDFNISNDRFIRTTDIYHKKGVINLWNRLVENGFIYLGNYSGWYSIKDETFYTEKDIKNDPEIQKQELKLIEEESYFFKLSSLQEKLLEHYETHPHFIYPQERREEVISFVKQGLNDLSISRSNFSWGIKVPNSKKHIIYVWIDALANYITNLDQKNIEEGKEFEQFWKNGTIKHIIGKDILRFHAIYWPAMLLALNINLPTQIITHGWWTNEGEKISKSLGNSIDPNKIKNEFGVDCLRYYLIKCSSINKDNDFSRNALISIFNTDLANNFGNLIQRTLKIIYNNFDKQIPIATLDLLELEGAYSMQHEVIDLLNGNKIHNILIKLCILSSETNSYLEKNEPWKLLKTNKDDKEKSANILVTVLEKIRIIAIIFQAFIPTSASKILDMLNIDINERQITNISNKYKIKSSRILEPTVVFQKIIINTDQNF